MPLTPREEIERIKREISVQRLAEARGIKLRRSGKELIGLCPFHKDTNPSLNIDPKKNEWHCKGACSEKFSSPKLHQIVSVMKVTGPANSKVLTSTSPLPRTACAGCVQKPRASTR